MALKDRQHTDRRPVVHGAPCSIGEVYRRNLADTAELDELHQVLYEDGLNATQVFDELRAAGYEVAHTAINKHRGQNCRCFRIDRDFCPDCGRHKQAHTDCVNQAA